MKDIPKVILLIETSRGYGRGLLRGITKYAHINGPWAFYAEPGGLNRALPRLGNWTPDGIIARDAKERKRIAEMGIPAVVATQFEEQIPGLGVILADMEAIAEMAKEHLLECGFRYFAFCGYDLPLSLIHI